MTSPPGAFDRFVRAAEHYCVLIEEPSVVGDRDAFISAVGSAVAELLELGLQLPEAGPSDVDAPEGLTYEEWSSTFVKIQTVLGDLPGGFEDYLAVPDDLADVWRALRDGLTALSSGTVWEDVSWEWKFGLQTHWGKHAEHALGALHDA